MEEKSIFERFQISAEEIFKEATLLEFFGNHLFETREQSYYLFTSGEHGDAVWLNPQLEAMQVEEARKFHPQPVIPQLCSFNHCEPIELTWFEDKRVKDIEANLRQGGKSLGQKANKAFIDVLNASISDKNTINAEEQNLDALLVDVFSRQVTAGFRPDRFIFPEHLEAKLVQLEIIIRDKEISSSHYVGQTLSGQRAFWSENLLSNTILMFDSKIGIMLTGKPRFDVIAHLRPFTPGVCGYLSLNAVVKNTQGVIAIANIDQTLVKPTGGGVRMQTPTQILYVDASRVNELKALAPSNFDLAKLVKLCEELNTCYADECYLAVTMLIRAILDHVPPIFGYTTFTEVAATRQYIVEF